MDGVALEDLSLKVEVFVFGKELAAAGQRVHVPAVALLLRLGLLWLAARELDLLEGVEHHRVLVLLDLGVVVVAVLLDLDGGLLLVTGKAEREAQSLLLSAEQLRFDELGSELVVEDVVLVDEAHHLPLSPRVAALVPT